MPPLSFTEFFPNRTLFTLPSEVNVKELNKVAILSFPIFLFLHLSMTLLEHLNQIGFSGKKLSPSKKETILSF